MTCEACEKMRAVLEELKPLVWLDMTHAKIMEALALPCSCAEPAPTPHTDAELWSKSTPELIVMYRKLERELADMKQTEFNLAGLLKTYGWKSEEESVQMFLHRGFLTEREVAEAKAEAAERYVQGRAAALAESELSQPRWIPYSERAPSEGDGCELWGNPTKYVMRLSDVIQPVTIYTAYDTGYWCRIVLPSMPLPVDPDEATVQEALKYFANYLGDEINEGKESISTCAKEIREAVKAALAHARKEGK